MPYVPPTGNAILFDFSGTYTAPAGNTVIFDFGATGGGPPSVAQLATNRLRHFFEGDPWTFMGPKRYATLYPEPIVPYPMRKVQFDTESPLAEFSAYALRKRYAPIVPDATVPFPYPMRSYGNITLDNEALEFPAYVRRKRFSEAPGFSGLGRKRAAQIIG